MNKPFRKRQLLLDAVTMFVVVGTSLALLIYVAFGEANRTYQDFQVDKLGTEGRVIQNAVAKYLWSGLPLRQYVGFNALAERIIASDKSIAAIVAYDRSEKIVFARGIESLPLLPPRAVVNKTARETFDPRINGELIQVHLPLRNRFETVGGIALTVPRAEVAKRVTEHFRLLPVVGAVLSLTFSGFVWILHSKFDGRRTSWLHLGYGLTFLIMASFVVSSLVTLYSEGAQAKTRALADMLGERLSDIVSFNINLRHIGGLEHTFGEYKLLNSDISSAALIVNGVIHVHSDSEQVGKAWTSDSKNYEYVVDLVRPGSFGNFRIAISLPVYVVVREVLRSVKNFVALFVASAFLANVFLNVAESVRRPRSIVDTFDGSGAVPDSDIAINSMKSIFFGAVFIEHLNYSFLPQFIDHLVTNAGLTSSYTSIPFMAYYLCFALSLLPAGHFAQYVSPRPLIYGGLLVAGAGLMLLAVGSSFYLVILARVLSGIGQGAVFIGVQSYLLLAAPPRKKTQSAAIIVLGYQGGMISGMAIGSLLVTDLGACSIFVLSASIALALAVHAVWVIPVCLPERLDEKAPGITWRQLATSIGRVARDIQFLKTMILVGVPAKAILTGVITFALPLILNSAGYGHEDIGQIIMIYAAAVIVASRFVSRIVDRTGRTTLVLLSGCLLTGLGLLLIDIDRWVGTPGGGLPFGTVALIIGVAVVGIAHGFVNAPVVTHVADSALAKQMGPSMVTATYRFLERAGHIAGPIIMGQLLSYFGRSSPVLSWIGVSFFLFGLLFAVRLGPAQSSCRVKVSKT